MACSSPWLTPFSLLGQYFCCRPCQVERSYLQCFDGIIKSLDGKKNAWGLSLGMWPPGMGLGLGERRDVPGRG